MKKEDFTTFRDPNKQIVFRWKISGWKKSLILTSHKNKLKIRLKLKIDGKDYHDSDLIVDKSLVRDGEYIRLSKKFYKPTARDGEPGIFLFENTVVKKVNKKNIFLNSVTRT